MTLNHCRTIAVFSASLLGLIAFISWDAPARADSTGGAVVPTTPKVSSLTCEDGRVAKCGIGQSLAVEGEGLESATSVVFLGRRGKRDDRTVRVKSKPSANSLTVQVPPAAKSGPVRVRSAVGSSVARRFTVKRPNYASGSAADKFYLDGKPVKFEYNAAAGTSIELVRLADQTVLRSWEATPGDNGAGSLTWNGLVSGEPASNGSYGFRLSTGGTAGPIAKRFYLFDHFFPIRGKHDLGQTATNSFGGGRGHQGLDMFAKCGTPIAAARGGTVLKAGFQSAAGNYVVIRRSDGRSYAYMHLIRQPLVKTGDKVRTGDALGNVGQTGRATGCHLHFEIWTAPGWYAGGKPIDPYPELANWDTWS